MNRFSPKGKLKEINGSILNPQNSTMSFILNILSLSGKTDGVMFPVFDKKWKKVKEEARGWYASRTNYKLGSIENTAVQSDAWVINMLCKDEANELDVKALDICLDKVLKSAKDEKACVHIAKLLLDEHKELQDKLQEVFINNGINVYIYN